MVAAIKSFVALATIASVIAVASPSFAQPRDMFAHNRDIWVSQDGAVHISRARAAALRYCNWIASTYYPEVENSHNRDSYYRACMASHGQLE